jgi:hypothetical protein
VGGSFKRSGEAINQMVLPNFSARWLIFIYLLANISGNKAGHLWTEADHLLKALTHLNPSVTAKAFKRILSSFRRQRTEQPGADRYQQVFSYLMCILGRLFTDQEAGNRVPSPVNGAIKLDDDTYLAVEMVYHQPGVAARGSSARGKENVHDDNGFNERSDNAHDFDHDYDHDFGVEHDLDLDSEWRYPSKEILILEERLTDRAKASLARLEALEPVKGLKDKGFKVYLVSIIVQSISVVKVLFKKD